MTRAERLLEAQRFVDEATLIFDESAAPVVPRRTVELLIRALAIIIGLIASACCGPSFVSCIDAGSPDGSISTGGTSAIVGTAATGGNGSTGGTSAILYSTSTNPDDCLCPNSPGCGFHGNSCNPADTQLGKWGTSVTALTCIVSLSRCPTDSPVLCFYCD